MFSWQLAVWYRLQIYNIYIRTSFCLNYHILATFSKDNAVQITQLLRSENIFIFVNPQIIQF